MWCRVGGMSELHVIVGGQFGSESKGRVAADLAKSKRIAFPHFRYYVRVAGPNAGHTAYDLQGRPWPLRQIPAMAVVDLDATLVIAAGSEIQVSVLQQEVQALEEAGIPIQERLLIDAQASILTGDHIGAETGMHEAMGSTGKGVGACRADRIMRTGGLAADYKADLEPLGHIVDGTGDLMRRMMRTQKQTLVIIEGTQGYGLGLHAGYYPHCTSSDCRATDFLAMADLSPWDALWCQVWVTVRTYPIRVAGPSGELYHETSWEALAQGSGGYIKPEYTTVTKKLRRVGMLDPGLVREAVLANGGSIDRHRVRVALSFFDYWYPELAGATQSSQLQRRHVEHLAELEEQFGAPIRLIGTGPNTSIWRMS